MAIAFDTTYAPRSRRTVATYATYTDAQRAVDRLSDADFPVEHADVVGYDLRVVEHVTGRLTSGRAAGAGAGIGAWWGLFIGLLVGLFTAGPAWLGLILGGLLIGAAWGAVLGYVAHSAMNGRRDFSSVTGLVAGRYELEVDDEYSERAKALLGPVEAAA